MDINFCELHSDWNTQLTATLFSHGVSIRDELSVPHGLFRLQFIWIIKLWYESGLLPSPFSSFERVKQIFRFIRQPNILHWKSESRCFIFFYSLVRIYWKVVSRAFPLNDLLDCFHGLKILAVGLEDALSQSNGTGSRASNVVWNKTTTFVPLEND